MDKPWWPEVSVTWLVWKVLMCPSFVPGDLTSCGCSRSGTEWRVFQMYSLTDIISDMFGYTNW